MSRVVLGTPTTWRGTLTRDIDLCMGGFDLSIGSWCSLLRKKLEAELKGRRRLGDLHP
jgi:hypothetical protein